MLKSLILGATCNQTKYRSEKRLGELISYKHNNPCTPRELQNYQRLFSLPSTSLNAALHH